MKNKSTFPKNSYDPEYFALNPSPWVRFFRVFWPWQFLRFIWINIKMIRILSKTHADEKQD